VTNQRSTLVRVLVPGRTKLRHLTRRTAVLLVVLAFAAVGCSRGSSGNPTTKGMVSRAENWGKYGVTHTASTGVTKIDKGTWKCTARVDGGKKIATTSCTGTGSGGQKVALTSSSTFDQLKKKKRGALPGNITITVDGVQKATLTCAGTAC
jgi:hypothetical protein